MKYMKAASAIAVSMIAAGAAAGAASPAMAADHHPWNSPAHGLTHSLNNQPLDGGRVVEGIPRTAVGAAQELQNAKNGVPKKLLKDVAGSATKGAVADGLPIGG
ncbi:hypothetical protein J7E91_01990 [Streptomyces sp. ISL-99]|uniref:hypothetical protein n=1 Tax=Streptomyces sp. ISL-99 TaxID=2819193 RepID=UPI001BEA6873|nr:hypothetical protein [Streptomyces sp. ISL-99]MBT2524235.1 hypothetical protein [Streptomyces sp. ISL-99]